MARNLSLHILRGLFSHMPTLNPGELYLCTDTLEVYIGSGVNQRVGVSSHLASGGTGSATMKGPNSWASGPAVPSTVKTFAQINIGGTVYWIPLFQ